MFLLGHSCWGYLFSKFFGRRLGVDVSPTLAFLAGILPDFDLYLQPLGLAHHTLTHSLLILTPLTIILVAARSRRGAAISIGILSHLFTDAIVGTLPIIFPLSAVQIGLSLGIPSANDTILEIGALTLTLLYMLRNGDAHIISRKNTENLWLSIPLISITTLTLLFAQDNNIQLIAYAFSRRALSAITLGHIALGITLSVGIAQGFRAITKASSKTTGRLN